MNKSEAIEIAREFARQKRRKLGKLLFAHFYDGEMLKEVRLDPPIRDQLSNRWCVWFCIHADYLPSRARVKPQGRGPNPFARAMDAALNRKPDEEYPLDPNKDTESFLIDPITGQVTEHRKPWPRWMRKIIDPFDAAFNRLLKLSGLLHDPLH